MKKDELIEKYPYLYHMAEKNSWSKISKQGLLSTSALLDLYEYDGAQRIQIEASLRPANVVIRHKQYGEAVIRDQHPMSDKGLQRCLSDGLTPTQWYKLLNERVFFWVTEERLIRLLSAGHYASAEHDVLVLDTAKIVKDYEKKITLCPMNSGCTKPFPHPRGKDTFLPIAKYPWEHWLEKRGRKGETVVEVAVIGSLQNVEIGRAHV